MEKEKTKGSKFVKTGLFLLSLVTLLLPSLQARLGVIRSKNLDGYFEPVPKPKASLKTWFSGDYQDQYMKSVEDSVGFHSDFVRIFNQVDYSLFSVPHPEKVVIGKNRMLFIWNYMMAWLGKGLKGDLYIEERVRRLKFLQDELWNRKKIMLLVVFPPEKAWAYPENIPSRYVAQKRVMGNYECYARKCKKYSINTLDVNKWFMTARDTSKELLFPLYGTHWSDYGAWLAADSMLRFLVNKMDRPFPNLVIDSIERSAIPRHNDNEISKLMNLIWELPDPVIAHPHLHATFAPGVTKPSVLVIGDSFYWAWEDIGFMEAAFGDRQFWYYDKDIYPYGASGNKKAPDLDLISEVEKRDVIIIIQVCGGVGDMGNGFID
ncbi:MAG: hypothetical protein WCL00_01230, partial [Bacteroidota bacterium]